MRTELGRLITVLSEQSSDGERMVNGARRGIQIGTRIFSANIGHRHSRIPMSTALRKFAGTKGGDHSELSDLEPGTTYLSFARRATLSNREAILTIIFLLFAPKNKCAQISTQKKSNSCILRYRDALFAEPSSRGSRKGRAFGRMSETDSKSRVPAHANQK